MTYGVLTIVLGLVIFLVSKLLPAKVHKQSANQNSENTADLSHKGADTPEKLAQWVLQTEKTKTELKEKLCRAPAALGSENLFGRDQVILDLFKAINKPTSLIELHGKPGSCLAPPGWVDLRASRLYDAATYLKEQLICR